MLILKKAADFLSNPHKKHLIDLPLVTRGLSVWDYPIAPDDAAAFVYTVYTDGRENRHHYAKGALYSALTFLDKTDLRDRGVPIYFVLQDTDYDELLPYFKLAGVKDEFVIPFTASGYRILKIMDAFYLPELQRYKRLFMVDPDVFVLPTPFFSADHAQNASRHAIIPMADSLLWDITQFDIAALGFATYKRETCAYMRDRFKKLKEAQTPYIFPNIGSTRGNEIVAKMASPRSRTWLESYFIGFSNKFLALIEKPYKKIAKFTTLFYRDKPEIYSYALVEEDLISAFIMAFQTNIHYLYNDITTVHHLYSCEIEDQIPYAQWKDTWLSEFTATINRHII